MTDEETPLFERGDVIYGADPFEAEETAPPCLVLSNHEGHLSARPAEATVAVRCLSEILVGFMIQCFRVGADALPQARFG